MIQKNGKLYDPKNGKLYDPKNGKLYDFTNLSAFKCSHHLDMNESSNGFHIDAPL